MPHLSVSIMTEGETGIPRDPENLRLHFVQLPPMSIVALGHMFGLASIGMELVEHNGLDRSHALLLEFYRTNNPLQLLSDYNEFDTHIESLLKGVWAHLGKDFDDDVERITQILTPPKSKLTDFTEE